MLNVVASNSLISAHIYMILEGPENVKIFFVVSLKSKQTNFHPVPVRNRLFCLHGQYIGRICPGLNIFLFAPFSRRCRSWSRSNVKEKTNFWYWFATIPINHLANVRVDRPQGKLLWVVLCSNTNTNLLLYLYLYQIPNARPSISSTKYWKLEVLSLEPDF